MFGGADRNLTLEGESRMAGVVIDRFGKDVMMHRSDDDHFRAHVTVAVSPQFFGWLTGVGEGGNTGGLFYRRSAVAELRMRYLGADSRRRGLRSVYRLLRTGL